MSPLAVFPHFIVLRWCRRARVRGVPGCTCVEGDGHLEPTNASVSGLKWPPTHFGGLCSSRRRRGSWWYELTASARDTDQRLPLSSSCVQSVTIHIFNSSFIKLVEKVSLTASLSFSLLIKLSIKKMYRTLRDRTLHFFLVQYKSH